MNEETAPKDEELGSMPLIEHLIELRNRIIKSVVAVAIAFGISFYFAGDIYNFLTQPLYDVWGNQANRQMIATDLTEPFFVHIKVAFFMAIFVSFPIIASQLWLFIAPGLYKNEKQAFLPFLLATPVMFLIGAAFVYYAVLPVAWEFFTSFEQVGQNGTINIALQPKINEYLSLVMQLILAFGICFELPVLLSLLVQVGIINTEQLKSKRRYAIVMAFVIAAVLTPPDPLSQVGLAVPLVLLYEISIWAGKLIEKRKAKLQ